MTGVQAVAAYLPHHRIDRAAAGLGSGRRTVASFDEDATSMAVEAARPLVDDGLRRRVDAVLFSTTSPGYADRTNATIVHAALDLPVGTAAFDAVGSVRSAVGALRSAFDGAVAGRTTLVVAGDVRIGLPGSTDERDGGDGAAAIVIGPEGDLAELVGIGSATAEFLDRWRVPGELSSRVWEERFGETTYVPLAHAALEDALKAAGATVDELDHLIVCGLHGRAVASVRRSIGVRAEALVGDLAGQVGNTGAAHPLLLLTDVLERAEAGQLVGLLTLADGADCLLLRVGAAAGAVAARTVAAQIEGHDVDAHDVLVWRGLLRREPPRRPDPDRPAAPPSSRRVGWKFGFVGGRCTECGTRHLPPERVCMRCGATDRMEREPLAGLQGTVTTYTIDHLAFSLSSPVVVAVVDLDGGGRLQCELADVDWSAVAVGDRVEMTFRRLFTTADGVHNYFWKARPVRDRG